MGVYLVLLQLHFLLDWESVEFAEKLVVRVEADSSLRIITIRIFYPCFFLSFLEIRKLF